MCCQGESDIAVKQEVFRGISIDALSEDATRHEALEELVKEL